MILKIFSALAAIGEIFKFFKGAWAMYKQAKTEGWIAEGRELAAKIKNAKSDAERLELLRRLNAHDLSAP